jgi:hypothetical protein
MSPASPRWIGALVLLLSAGLALGSARDYAGSYNDGSRLATVEALVDHGTLAIDDSIFVRPPPDARPYNPAFAFLNRGGTGDKMFVGGRFYSHQPPVPAVLLAGAYALLQAAFGLKASATPNRFCFVLTLVSSGLAYVVAVWCVYRLAAALRLAPLWGVALTASFALATVTAAYARFVNAHILLLATAAGLFLVLTRWSLRPTGRAAAGRLLAVGFLAGLGYAIEQPTGGLLAAGACFLVAFRRAAPGDPAPGPRWAGLGGAALIVAAALPWAVLHHALTYAIAGTFSPPAADPAVFDYPGSDFTAKELTGRYNHADVGDLLHYAGALLLSDRGFLNSNLPLFLAVPALFLLPRGLRERPEAWLACAWALGTWAVFALLSTNFAGWCCSIRWFVPLLAGGYFLLALLLRERPDVRRDFLVLSAWGVVLGAIMWGHGTWYGEVPGLWHVQALALASWLATTRLLPPLVDRCLDRLAQPLWLALGVCALLVLLSGWPPVTTPGPDDAELESEWPLLTLLGLVLGVRARADRHAGPAGPWLTLGLALLAALGAFAASLRDDLHGLAWWALLLWLLWGGWRLKRLSGGATASATGAAPSR